MFDRIRSWLHRSARRLPRRGATRVMRPGRAVSRRVLGPAPALLLEIERECEFYRDVL